MLRGWVINPVSANISFAALCRVDEEHAALWEGAGSARYNSVRTRFSWRKKTSGVKINLSKGVYLHPYSLFSRPCPETLFWTQEFLQMTYHNVPHNTQERLSLRELCQAGKKIEKGTICKNSIKQVLLRLDYMLWPWFERVASYGSVYRVNLNICSFNSLVLPAWSTDH